ncbi:hypothetical protein Bbelb_379540 [Branchiostoma belcheri]|nr:hypothetical protein Bbelb_379540 [Branchiostoma belcheri]
MSPPRKSARVARRREDLGPPQPTDGGNGLTPEGDITSPPRKVPNKPKLTMKTLQQQLQDLQQITAQLVNKLDSSTPGHGPTGVLSPDDQNPAHSRAEPETSSQNNTLQTLQNNYVTTHSSTPSSSTGVSVSDCIYATSVLPASSQAGSTRPIGHNLPLSTTTPLSLATGIIPVYTTSSSWGLQPPYLPPSTGNPTGQVQGLGSTLASNIIGTPSVTHTVSTATCVEPASALGNPVSAQNLDNELFQAGVHLPLDTGISEKHITRSSQLISYGYLIRSMADRGAQWNRYDTLFRQLKQGDKCLAASCPFRHDCPICAGAHKIFTCPKKISPSIPTPVNVEKMALYLEGYPEREKDYIVKAKLDPQKYTPSVSVLLRRQPYREYQIPYSAY